MREQTPNEIRRPPSGCRNLDRLRQLPCPIGSLMLLLFLTCGAVNAQQVFPITFNPHSPSANENVTIRFFKSPCVLTVDLPSQIDVHRVNNQVDVIIDGTVVYNDVFCVFSSGDVTLPIGRLTAGDHSVRVIIRDIVPPFILFPPIAEGGISISPASIPSLTFSAMAVLSITLALLGLISIRLQKRALLLSICGVIITSTLASAAEIQPNALRPLYVLISSDPRAPPPESVVEHYDFLTGENPPFEALRVESPVSAAFLLPVRATDTFHTHLTTNPDSARSFLERYMIVFYPPSANMEHAITAWTAEPYALSVSEPLRLEFPLQPATAVRLVGVQGKATAVFNQTWIDAMSFPAAWALAGGWGLVGMLDSGIAIDHPDLKAFGAGNVLTGGNFLQAYAIDNGRYVGQPFPLANGIIDYNVDERQPRDVDPFSLCDPDGNGQMQTSVAGHGTHTAGLVAANAANADGTVGTCRNCGLAIVKVSQDVCDSLPPPYYVRPTLNALAIPQGITYLIDNGVQVINGSFGMPFAVYGTNCILTPLIPECISLKYASDNGVVVVASSGNYKRTLDFPARDSRVIAAGGLIEDGLTFWENRADLPPAELSNGCLNVAPLSPPMECGSNFSQTGSEPKQGLVAQARNVGSLAYPGYDWNALIRCGDAFGTASGDGKGFCTGTSMSAPLIAGLAGLLRSVNPLVPVGDPESSADALGIRDGLIAGGILGGTASWDQRLGYGRVNAAGSVRSLLGASGGATMTNRLTPLFALYGAGASDWAYTTVPQVATALMIKGLSGGQGLIDASPNIGDWLPSGTLVAGYPAFPGLAMPGIPRSDVFVFTTEHKVVPSHPALTPIYWMDRKRNLPIGCLPGPGCDSLNRDFLLVTSLSDLTIAVNEGYTYRGIQGYVFQRCAPEPACIPVGAQRMYRQCSVARDDCAIFLDAQKAIFEASGYTTTYPAGASAIIGYAYPNVDSDGDKIVDGQEILLGSKLNSADSDQDGVCDGVEYPLAGFSVTDICSDGRCSSGFIFSGGFESLGICVP